MTYPQTKSPPAVPLSLSSFSSSSSSSSLFLLLLLSLTTINLSHQQQQQCSQEQQTFSIGTPLSTCSSTCPSNVSTFTTTNTTCTPTPFKTSGPSDTMFYHSTTLAEGLGMFQQVVNQGSGTDYGANAFSLSNSALDMDGTAFAYSSLSQSQFTQNLPTGDTPFTVSAWVRSNGPSGLLGYMPILSWGKTGMLTPLTSPASYNKLTGFTMGILKTRSATQVVTLAGTGTKIVLDGTVSTACFGFPQHMMLNIFTNDIYIYDDARIRKIGADGTVSTFAGNGTCCCDCGPPTLPCGAGGFSFTLDYTNSSYVYTTGCYRINKVHENGGPIEILVGSGVSMYSDGVAQSASFIRTGALALDYRGNLYVVDYRRIRKVYLPNATVTTLVGSGSPGTADGIGTAASFDAMGGMVYDSLSNSIFVTEQMSVRKIDVATAEAKNYGGSSFSDPKDIAVDLEGNLYVADRTTNRIKRINTARGISNLASTTTFSLPEGVAVDLYGNVYVADTWNGIIKAIVQTTSPAIADNRWHHVLMSYYGSNAGGINSLKTFVDGTLAATANAGFDIVSGGEPYVATEGSNPSSYKSSVSKGPAAICVGAGYCDQFNSLTPTSTSSSSPLAFSKSIKFIGSVSDIRIYNRTLTTREITALSQPPMGWIPSSAPIPNTPTLGSSSYWYECMAGYSGGSVQLVKSGVDLSWSWSGGKPLRCSPCLSGTYASLSGTTTCIPCSAGYYGVNGTQLTSFASACAKCPQGSFSSSNGAQVCTLCDAGSYNPLEGQSSCVSCPVGFYGTERGATSASVCRSCPKGTFGGGSSFASCVNCPSGSASSIEGSTVNTCLSCEPGFFSGAGASRCLPCPPGSIAPFPDAATCIACPPGQAKVAGVNSSFDRCSDCSPGSFAPTSSSQQCQLCPTGSYSSFPGQQQCTMCDAGYFSNAVGATNASTCARCPAGTFNPAPGQSFFSCQNCPSGYASAVEGATSIQQCTPCLSGYAAAAGSTECIRCKKGTYAMKNASSVCEECPQSTYGSESGATSIDSCLSCPVGATTIVTGATSVDQCITKSFTCPSGTQAFSSSTAPTSSADCVPLICRPPLVLADGRCISCLMGYTINQTLGICQACNSSRGEICPGTSVQALLASTSALLTTMNPTMSSSGSSSVWKCGKLWLESSTPTNGGASADSTSSSSSSPSSTDESAVIGTGVAIIVTVFLSYIASFLHSSKTKKMKGSSNTTPLSSSSSNNRNNSEKDDYIHRKVTSLLENIDAFHFAHILNVGDAVTKRPTALGGVFTVAGNVSLAVLALLLIIRRNADNVLVQSSLNIIESTLWTQSSNIVEAESFATSSSSSDSSWSGMRVRLTLLGDNATICRDLLSFNYAELPKGSFVSEGGAILSSSSSNTAATTNAANAIKSSATRCDTGSQLYWNDEYNVDGTTTTAVASVGRASVQHTWVCKGCLFSEKTKLEIIADYSCQVFVLEVAAVRADGSVSVAQTSSLDGIVSRSDSGSNSGSGGVLLPLTAVDEALEIVERGLITSVAYEVATHFSILENTIKGISWKGYSVIDVSSLITRSPLASYSGGGSGGGGGSNSNAASLLPLSNSIVFSVTFPLQPFYSSVIWVEKVSLIQLVSSIIGLASVLSIFQMIFSQVEHRFCKARNKTGQITKGGLIGNKKDGVQEDNEEICLPPMSSLHNGNSENTNLPPVRIFHVPHPQVEPITMNPLHNFQYQGAHSSYNSLNQQQPHQQQQQQQHVMVFPPTSIVTTTTTTPSSQDTQQHPQSMMSIVTQPQQSSSASAVVTHAAVYNHIKEKIPHAPMQPAAVSSPTASASENHIHNHPSDDDNILPFVSPATSSIAGSNNMQEMTSHQNDSKKHSAVLNSSTIFKPVESSKTKSEEEEDDDDSDEDEDDDDESDEEEEVGKQVNRVPPNHWFACSDEDGDVWYIRADGTAESVWELPAGAVVVQN